MSEKYLHQKLMFTFSDSRQLEACSIFNLLIMLGDVRYLWFYSCWFLEDVLGHLDLCSCHNPAIRKSSLTFYLEKLEAFRKVIQ